MSPALPGALGRVRGHVRRTAPSGFPWSAPTWPGGIERPAPDRGVGVDYDTDWSRRYGARLVRAMVLDNVTRPLTHVLATPTVVGGELLELVEPPAIFVANHSSHFDTPVVLSVLPPRIRHKMAVAAAADHFFDRRWKSHLWALSLAALPIERHRVNRRSADLAAALVEDGWNLVIYPEGGRTPDGWLQEFRGGAAYLAVRTGRPVVPVHLEGTYRILPKDGDRLRRNPTQVTFGSPLVPDDGEDARRFGTRIEAALATLADESQSDWWSARRRAAAGTTPSARGPAASPWRRAWALPTTDRQGAEPDARRWAIPRD
jgi:1-acyl-sn-glycerol-3-phosphate acyltransferase